MRRGERAARGEWEENSKRDIYKLHLADGGGEARVRLGGGVVLLVDRVSGAPEARARALEIGLERGQPVLGV